MNTVFKFSSMAMTNAEHASHYWTPASSLIHAPFSVFQKLFMDHSVSSCIDTALPLFDTTLYILIWFECLKIIKSVSLFVFSRSGNKETLTFTTVVWIFLIGLLSNACYIIHGRLIRLMQWDVSIVITITVLIQHSGYGKQWNSAKSIAILKVNPFNTSKEMRSDCDSVI